MGSLGQIRWIFECLRQSLRRPWPHGRPLHVLLCICDHYEPGNGHAPEAQADQRVGNWVEQYPKLFARFKDSDGRRPRHTFFYPIEMYRPGEVERIAGLCRAGFGEVEVHLHHDHDTAENLRNTLVNWKQLLHERHGLLCQDRQSGATQFAFIHGNWALNNSRPDGRWCGVDNELEVLRDTGCYADFTFPSYPDASQPGKTNSIYYVPCDATKPAPLNGGVDVGTGPRPRQSLMLVQGPLIANWKSRRFGVVPRIENANIQGNQPPTDERLDLWIKSRIQIPTRPDWLFVKLHTHGAPESNQRVLLGEPMVKFHEGLAARAAADANFHYHYLTAREMYNLIKAAEAGWKGTVEAARDQTLIWPCS